MLDGGPWAIVGRHH